MKDKFKYILEQMKEIKKKKNSKNPQYVKEWLKRNKKYKEEIKEYLEANSTKEEQEEAEELHRRKSIK